MDKKVPKDNQQIERKLSLAFVKDSGGDRLVQFIKS